MSDQAASNEKIIVVENICKSYAYYKKDAGLKGSIKNLFKRKKLYKPAVKNLSFEITQGSITGLIGLNGAGKTTTLKMLSGLILPTEGSLTVLQHNPFEKKKEYLRQISMVMGNKSQLWWDLPAVDSFELNKTIYEVEDADYKKTLHTMIEILGVQKQVNVQVRRLSLGERMKMELIAALIHKPKLIFLDEPTIGLDIITQYNIRDFLKHYCNKYQADKIIKTLQEKGNFFAEKTAEDTVKISADSTASLDILKNISNDFIEELSDITIENISMEDVIRRLYTSSESIL